MGEWYWWGLAAGLGAAIGVLFAGLLGWHRIGAVVAVVVAAGAGLVVGLGIGEWDEAAACAAGAALGALGTVPFTRRSVQSGGTPAGTAVLLSGAALGVGLLALVPALGYVEAIVVPVLGLRLGAQAPKRYAGLRTLAR